MQAGTVIFAVGNRSRGDDAIAVQERRRPAPTDIARPMAIKLAHRAGGRATSIAKLGAGNPFRIPEKNLFIFKPGAN